MNKENFTQRYVSNPSCRTTVFPRVSVQRSFFNGLSTIFYDLFEMLRSKINATS